MASAPLPQTTSPDPLAGWTEVTHHLFKEVGHDAYQKWIAVLHLLSVHDNRAQIAAPSQFVADWVKTHYWGKIEKTFFAAFPVVQWLDLIVDASLARPANPFTVAGMTAPRTPSTQGGLASGSFPAAPFASGATKAYGSFARANNFPLAEGPLQAHLDTHYTFENFIVGKSNELAYAAALRVVESETPAFNPLFLYGGVGLGKTHLMHAIAWKLRQEHPSRRVIYLSAEKFMYQFICALRQKDMVSFKEQFRSVDVLMIDDVQFISGKDSTQEEFFHTFNALVDQNKQIILSADKSPSDLEGMEERLRSRLGWGLVADIHPTTYELRLGILQSKVDQLTISVPEKVLEFLAHKITSNVRELEGALKRIAAHSSLVGRQITLDLTQEVLKDLLRANDRRTNIDDIKKKVAERYALKLSELEGVRRQRSVARPRQIAMYLCKTLTTKSLPEIGRAFGGRDHSTIIHAVKTIQQLQSEDPSLAEDIDILVKILTS